MTFRSQLGGKPAKPRQVCLKGRVTFQKAPFHIASYYTGAADSCLCHAPVTFLQRAWASISTMQKLWYQLFFLLELTWEDQQHHIKRAVSHCQDVQGWESHQSQQGAQFIRAQPDDAGEHSRMVQGLITAPGIYADIYTSNIVWY